MRPWILAETNYTYTKENSYQVAMLPLGATEPHNLHLPYGSDILESTVIGEHVCEAAHRQGAKVVMLPTIPYGTETNLRNFPLAMNLNPSTLNQVVADLIESLVGNGILKIVLLNGHGGNELKSLLRELYGKTDAHLFLCNWYQMVADEYLNIFEQRDDHAGEMETSFAMAYYPDLVLRRPDGSLAADEGRPAATRFEALNRGWVAITRPWHLLTRHAGVGDPRAATADKGRRMLDLIVERLTPFLVELSNAELDERFPY